MWKLLSFIGLKGAALIGLGGTGVAYWKSKQALDEDMKDGKLDGKHYFKNDADKFVQNTAIPLAKDAVSGIFALTGATVAGATGLKDNETVKSSVKGLSDSVNSGLVAANQFRQELPSPAEAATAAGQGVKVAADTTVGTASSFVDSILPKGVNGWLRTAAVAGVLALTGWGASKATGFTAGEKFFGGITGLPGRAIQGVGSLLYGALSSIVMPIVAVAALGWLFLTPNGRQLLSGGWEMISGFFGGKKPEHPERHKVPEPQVAPAAPAKQQTQQYDAPQGPVASVDMRNINMGGVSGGENATTIVTPGRQEMASNPSRDPRNTRQNIGAV